jgi:hypothetical protein
MTTENRENVIKIAIYLWRTWIFFLRSYKVRMIQACFCIGEWIDDIEENEIEGNRAV